MVVKLPGFRFDPQKAQKPVSRMRGKSVGIGLAIGLSETLRPER